MKSILFLLLLNYVVLSYVRCSSVGSDFSEGLGSSDQFATRIQSPYLPKQTPGYGGGGGGSGCNIGTTCVELPKCPAYLQLLRQKLANGFTRVQEAICGFNENGVAKVCCVNKVPPVDPVKHPNQLEASVVVDTEEIRRRIDSHRNLALLPPLSKCGSSVASDRIVGGKTATLGAYPWIVLLGYKDTDGGVQWACGGSLITNWMAMSASHCTANLPKGIELAFVRIGEHNQKTDPDCDSAGLCAPRVQEVQVAKIINHPLYNRNGTTDSDISLIVFKKPCVFNAFVQPVCLPRGLVAVSIPPNSIFNVAGWGRTDFRKEDGSDILQELAVPVVSKRKCEESHRRQTKNNQYKITSIDSSRFCAGGESGKDSCRGDSGGPLMSSVPVPDLKNQRKTFQWGVVSVGPAQCGNINEPVLYTKVVHFMPWILDNVQTGSVEPVTVPATTVKPNLPKYDCYNSKEELGVCVEVEKCEPIFTVLKERTYNNDFILHLQKSTCGWAANGDPKVCCPHLGNQNTAVKNPNQNTDNSAVSTTGESSENTHNKEKVVSAVVTSRAVFQRIKSHRNLHLLPTTKNCGSSFGSDRIIGGQDAGLGNYPWVVLLAFSEGAGEPQFACGGSLISSRYVLSAAHCTDKSTLPKGFDLKFVRIGEYDQKKDPDCVVDVCAPKIQDIPVEEVITHAEYNKELKKENDISLIRLQRPVRMGPFVQPICLPTKEYVESVPDDTKFTVAGWGRTDFRTPASSPILQEVVVPLIATNVCEDYYRNKTNGRINKIETNRFCAGGELGKDSCKGDSGGPMMSALQVQDLRNQRRFFQFGIVSLGPVQCGSSNQPALYTKITDSLPWILDNLKQ